MEVIKSVIEEIALNGLEGLTLSGLWKLLSERDPPLLDKDDEEMKSFIWQGIQNCGEIGFWWLNLDQEEKVKEKKKETRKRKRKPREKILTDEYIDLYDSTQLPKNWVADTENDVFGYCSNYFLRESVTSVVTEAAMSHIEVLNKWGEDAYIVATQALRRRTLLGDSIPLDVHLTGAQFTFLEIIGKTRERGFLQKDFRVLMMDPRTSFHFINILIKIGVVTKQLFTLRGEARANGNAQKIRTNILFLKRFHRTVRAEVDIYSEKLLKGLAASPGNVMGMQESFKKMACSKKFFRSIRRKLYRRGYIQYIQNGKVYNHENGIESLASQVHSAAPLYIHLLKPYKANDGIGVYDDDDDEDEESLYISKCQYTQPQVIRGFPLLQQAYWIVASAKERGMTIDEFGALSCVPYYMARSFFRQLEKRDFIKRVNTDKAKQKVFRFISTRYLHQSDHFKKINEEVGKTEDYKQNWSESWSKSIASVNKKPDKCFEGDNQETDVSMLSSASQLDLDEVSNEPVKKTDELVKKADEEMGNLGTVRGIRRQNKIFEIIKDIKVIEGSNQIYKAVLKSEQDQGIKERVCRKSILRILSRMVKEGLIKRFEVVISTGEAAPESAMFYCDSNITMEDDIFKAAVHETKFRVKKIVENRMQRKQERTAKATPEKSIPNHDKKSPHHITLLELVTTDKEAVNGDETDTDNDDYEPVTGTGYQRAQYGYLPRFPRIKMLHFYIWQLVYGGEDGIPRELSYDFDEHGDGYYLGSFSWLTQLQKLPPYRNGKGYFQTGDALAIMPLITFTKCVGICFRSKTLEKLLEHPTKRYTPLRDLPPRLKAKLFRARSVGSYIGHFIESIILLTHMGLLHVTPEKLPANRTQIILFVSNEAMLVDTTLSEKGYSKTRLPGDIEAFPKQLYKLDDLVNLYKYWKDVQFICLNTKLGLLRALRKPKEESEEAREKQPRVHRSFMTLRDFQEHFPIEDPCRAVPQLYGDGLGAAGFDSSFFGHLPKNWAYTDSKQKQISMLNERRVKGIADERIAVPLTGFSSRSANSVVTKPDGGKGKRRKRVFDNKIVSGASHSKKAKVDEKSATTESDDLKLTKLLAVKYRQKLTKVVKSTQKSKKDRGHKCVKDDVDFAAMKRKVSIRVRFSAREDAAILMVRMTADLLELDPKRVNYWVEGRNIIHKEISESCDKTTEALGRRSRYMLKNSLTMRNMKSCILECTADPTFSIKKPGMKGDSWKSAFREMYQRVKARFRDKISPAEFAHELPDTMKELKESFVVSKAYEESDKIKCKAEMLTSKDIILCVLEQLVHNSLASQNLKEYIPSLVFHVFDRYPANLLQDALMSLKAKSLISRQRLSLPRRRALPISTMTYTLSVNYERIFEMPFGSNIFPAARNFMRLLRDGAKHVGRSHFTKHQLKENSKAVNALDENGGLESSDVKGDSKESIKEPPTSSMEKLSNQRDDVESGQAESVSFLSTSGPLTPGSLMYSKEESLGGHVACMFSLMINNKAIVDVEIPDDVVECDQSMLQKLGKSGDENPHGTITLLRRKLCSDSAEDSLFADEDLRDEESGQISDDDDDDFVGENRAEECSTSMNESPSGSANNALSRRETLAATICEESPLQAQREILARSCLKAISGDAGVGDESAVPKKRRKVTFEDDARPSTPPRGELCAKPAVAELAVDADTEQGINELSALHGETSLKRTLMETDTADDDGASPTKRQKISTTNSERKQNISGALNFQIRTANGSIAFLSDRYYIEKFKDSEYSNTCDLTSEFNYSDDQEQGVLKMGSTVVPKRSLKMRKTRMYASRTTLMLHRSFEQDQEQPQARTLSHHENLVLNPMKIACHLHLKPHSDESTSAKNANAGSSTGNSNNLDAKISRFLERKQISYSNSDLDRDSVSEDIIMMNSLMKEHFGWNEEEVAFVDDVMQNVMLAGEIGLTEDEISRIYLNYKDIRPTDEIVDMLINFRILIRAGIRIVRLVARNFASNWCMHTPVRIHRGSNPLFKEKGKAKSMELKTKDSNVVPDKLSLAQNAVDTILHATADFGKEYVKTGKEANDSLRLDDASTTSNEEIRKDNTTQVDNKAVDIATIQTSEVRDSNCIEFGGEQVSKTEISHNITEQTKNIGLEKEASCADTPTVLKFDEAKKPKLPHGVKDSYSQKPRDKVVVSHTGYVDKETALKDNLLHLEGAGRRFHQIVCKPWQKLNCDYNHVVLRKFQRAVLSLIMMCPGILESAIHGHFRTVATGVALREVLLFLELNGCITKHPSGIRKKPRLFDPPNTTIGLNLTFDNPYYMPTSKAVLNLTDQT